LRRESGEASSAMEKKGAGDLPLRPPEIRGKKIVGEETASKDLMRATSERRNPRG